MGCGPNLIEKKPIEDFFFPWTLGQTTQKVILDSC